jgi:hypothetical protein
MKKRPYTLASVAKPTLSWEKTWARLFQFFKDPSALRPLPLSEEDRLVVGASHQQQVLPEVKGNVCHTMKEILRLFLKSWKDAPRAVNYSVRTTYTSLAKLCRNRDPKTAYLHVLALIEFGFLRGKQRLSRGVTLLLNPDLLVFEETSTAPALSHFPAQNESPRATLPSFGEVAGRELTEYPETEYSETEGMRALQRVRAHFGRLSHELALSQTTRGED